MSYQERLLRAIPGGAHTYSKGFDQFPSNAPAILERGEGAFVVDPDGRRFLDYGMGLRSVTLGYGYPSVAEAAEREVRKGNNLTRPSTTELEAAELIVDLIPSAEMVKFAKNGSNVTTGAVKVARAFTGRDLVCIPRQHPFFSFDDWFIGTTPVKRGIPDDNTRNTLLFDYGDISSLEALFDEHQEDIACVMLEPATTQTPCSNACDGGPTYARPCNVCPTRASNFLARVQDICRRNGALFILDEMITGFRWQLEGAGAFFGVEPDLSTFGKGMANGFSVSALVGRREVMEVGSIERPGVERTFLLSTTHGAEMSSLGAFVATVGVYKERDVCGHLWDYGGKLRDGLNSLAAESGIGEHFEVEGPAIAMNYITRDGSGEASRAFRTLFSQEMVKSGVLIPWMAVSLSHGEEELDLTLSAARSAFSVYADALEAGVDRFLEGPPVQPVFRSHN